jgi:hypothetical protein
VRRSAVGTTLGKHGVPTTAAVGGWCCLVYDSGPQILSAAASICGIWQRTMEKSIFAIEGKEKANSSF